MEIFNIRDTTQVVLKIVTQMGRQVVAPPKLVFFGHRYPCSEQLCSGVVTRFLGVSMGEQMTETGQIAYFKLGCEYGHTFLLEGSVHAIALPLVGEN